MRQIHVGTTTVRMSLGLAEVIARKDTVHTVPEMQAAIIVLKEKIGDPKLKASTAALYRHQLNRIEEKLEALTSAY